MENVLIERVKNQAKNLKVLAEELQVQMALGKAEARDLLEVERKNLSTYINKQREEIKNLDSSYDANRRELLTCVENLESNLNNSVPEEAAEYDTYKNNVLNSIYQLEEVLRNYYPSMDTGMQEKLESFKSKMDAFRVNLAIHDKDNPEKVDRIRKEFTEMIVDIRSLLSKREDQQSRIDHFVEDISESFNYLKKAITDLSKE